jgi:hypothetical protein
VVEVMYGYVDYDIKKKHYTAFVLYDDVQVSGFEGNRAELEAYLAKNKFVEWVWWC